MADKTLVQCDFDGTVTKEDISFLILDAFGPKDWRKLFKDYEDGKISVGQFNQRVFSAVKADKQTQLDLVRQKGNVRPGLKELVEACRRKNFRFVIVSNGLRFYIDDILESAGLNGVEVRAAENRFDPAGMQVEYLGPDGAAVDRDFKLAYTKYYLAQGYRLIYLGDGHSDFSPAKKSQIVFATGSLLKLCREDRVDCIPFIDLRQVAATIEAL